MARDEQSPAFYALPGGGWRDWWTLLHPPYTIWHLSYVVLGAAAAPKVRLDRLGATVLAFFLAVGLGAHALDELNGRPLRTLIPASKLHLVATISIAGAVGIGVVGVAEIGPTLIPFILFGAFIAVAYNLELFGARLHNDFWFAFAWGAFPAFTGFWSSGVSVRISGFLVAAACLMLSVTQRSLSTPVRALRRRTAHVEGTIERTDGTVEQIDKHSLGAAPEAALRALSVALPLLALGALIARLA
jgi:hypothetical protein